MTTENIRIRAAEAGDIAALLQFNVAMALETEGKTLATDVLRQGIATILAESRRGFYLVAEAADRVVGCLMVTYEWSDWRNGDWWWLQSVYVDPVFRRSGVFRALHQSVEQRARAASGVVGLRLYVENGNTRAQATYARMGMRQAHYTMWERAFPMVE